MAGHQIAEVERELDKALVCADGLWQCADGELVDAVRAAHRMQAKAKALELKAVAELEARGYALAQGATSGGRSGTGD